MKLLAALLLLTGCVHRPVKPIDIECWRDCLKVRYEAECAVACDERIERMAAQVEAWRWRAETCEGKRFNPPFTCTCRSNDGAYSACPCEPPCPCRLPDGVIDLECCPYGEAYIPVETPTYLCPNGDSEGPEYYPGPIDVSPDGPP